MNDATPTAVREGYITVAYPYQGTVYNFTFYEGFVGRLVLRPQGGPPVEVYRQKDVYHVPQPQSGEVRGPDAHSTVTVSGGPSDLDIEMEVDDTPQDDRFQGPIKKIKLRACKKGGQKGAAGNEGKGKGPSVRVLRGEDQVAALSMEMKPGRGASRGGVEAFQTSPPGDDEVVVENGAKICPPYCDKP